MFGTRRLSRDFFVSLASADAGFNFTFWWATWTSKALALVTGLTATLSTCATLRIGRAAVAAVCAGGVDQQQLQESLLLLQDGVGLFTNTTRLYLKRVARYNNKPSAQCTLLLTINGDETEPMS